MSGTSGIQHPECQNPNCEEEGTKTYRDNRGNSVKVCPRHHYELVTGSPTISYTSRNIERGERSVLDHLRGVSGR